MRDPFSPRSISILMQRVALSYLHKGTDGKGWGLLQPHVLCAGDCLDQGTNGYTSLLFGGRVQFRVKVTVDIQPLTDELGPATCHRRITPCKGGGGGLASQPRRYQVPGQPLLNRHQVGGVSRSPDGLFAQQEREPNRGRPAVRGKRTYGGRPGQRVQEQGTWASQKHSEAGYGRPVHRGVWTAKTVK